MGPELLRDWLRVPYDGPPNNKLVIVVDGTEHRAYYDRGWAQAKVLATGMVSSVELQANGIIVGRWSVLL